MYFEIDLDTFEPMNAKELMFEETSKFPGIDYDISLNVIKNMRFENISNVWEKENFEILKSVKVIDVYETIGLKSITLRFSFGLMDRSLTNEEVQKCMDKIIIGLENIGVTMRS